MILDAMPKSYRPLITALELVDQLTVETAKSKLLHEALRQKERATEIDEVGADQVAMATKAGRSPVICHFCKKPGHIKPRCRLWKRPMLQVMLVIVPTTTTKVLR